MHGTPHAVPAVRDLHVCRSCGRPFVAVRRLLGVADGGYVVELACANCGWRAMESHDGHALAALDRAIEQECSQMQAAADRLAMACELERIDRFAAALEAGLILPEDF